jgi:hypothetical protein
MSDLMITDPSYEQVDKCANSNEGENILHEFGVETGNLDPEHYGVPWITFDHVSKQ